MGAGTNPAYAEMARERIASDAPLFGALSEPEPTPEPEPDRDGEQIFLDFATAAPGSSHP